jgi:S1-C subfamily serine protease
MPPVRYRSISELLDNKSITLDFEDPEMEVKLILFKEEEEENIYEKISTGSAFFIDSVHIVTNCHVIEDASRILISIGGIPYQCVPEKKSKTYDLAILRVIGYESRQSATFARGNAQVGDLCYAVGYPYSNIIGSDLKFTSGIISGRNGIAGDSTCYQITAPIDPGNSGCPLIDANGNIIGIISAKLKLGTNIGYAVKERYLFGLWPNLKYARKKATKTAPDIYKEASNYTYLIKSYIL